MTERGPISRLRHLLDALRGATAEQPRTVAEQHRQPRVRRVAFCKRKGQPLK